MSEWLEAKIKLLGELWCGYCGRFIQVATVEEFMKHLENCEYYQSKNRRNKRLM